MRHRERSDSRAAPPLVESRDRQQVGLGEPIQLRVLPEHRGDDGRERARGRQHAHEWQVTPIGRSPSVVAELTSPSLLRRRPLGAPRRPGITPAIAVAPAPPAVCSERTLMVSASRSGRRRLEDRTQRQLHAEPRADARGELSREKRVAAEGGEEVVVAAHPLDAEHLPEQRGDRRRDVSVAAAVHPGMSCGRFRLGDTQRRIRWSRSVAETATIGRDCASTRASASVMSFGPSAARLAPSKAHRPRRS